MMKRDECERKPSFRSGVEDAAGGLGEGLEAGAIDAVVHEGAAPLGFHETHVA